MRQSTSLFYPSIFHGRRRERRDVKSRVSEHQQGLIAGCYTSTRRPVKLIYSETYERVDEAIAAERRMKGWSRAKKEAHMRGDFERLSELAKRGSKKYE